MLQKLFARQFDIFYTLGHDWKFAAYNIYILWRQISYSEQEQVLQ